jgi:hypothetical protein
MGFLRDFDINQTPPDGHETSWLRELTFSYVTLISAVE